MPLRGVCYPVHSEPQLHLNCRNRLFGRKGGSQNVVFAPSGFWFSLRL